MTQLSLDVSPLLSALAIVLSVLSLWISARSAAATRTSNVSLRRDGAKRENLTLLNEGSDVIRGITFFVGYVEKTPVIRDARPHDGRSAYSLKDKELATIDSEISATFLDSKGLRWTVKIGQTPVRGRAWS